MADHIFKHGLAVLGAGKMGGILIEAFLKHGLVSPHHIFATVQQSSSERRTISSAQITPGNNNHAAAEKSDVILVCLKPLSVGHVLDEIRDALTPKNSSSRSPPPFLPPISNLASARKFRSFAPCRIRLPWSAKASPPSAKANTPRTSISKSRANFLMPSVKPSSSMRNIWTPSLDFPAAARLFSTSFSKRLAEGGVKMGLSRELATLLAAQTMLGAAKRRARNGPSSRYAERHGNDSRWLHHRRNSRIGRRQTARHADQSRGQSLAACQGTNVHRKLVLK